MRIFIRFVLGKKKNLMFVLSVEKPFLLNQALSDFKVLLWGGSPTKTENVGNTSAEKSHLTVHQIRHWK